MGAPCVQCLTLQAVTDSAAVMDAAVIRCQALRLTSSSIGYVDISDGTVSCLEANGDQERPRGLLYLAFLCFACFEKRNI